MYMAQWDFWTQFLSDRIWIPSKYPSIQTQDWQPRHLKEIKKAWEIWICSIYELLFNQFWNTLKKLWKLVCKLFAGFHFFQIMLILLRPWPPWSRHTASICLKRWQFWIQSVKITTKHLTFLKYIKLVPYASLCLGNYLDQIFVKFWVDWGPF